MAVNSGTIKSQINSLINSTKTMEQPQSQEVFAQGLADIVRAAILSATVTVNAGIAVSTSGGAGATTGSGTGSLT